MFVIYSFSFGVTLLLSIPIMILSGFRKSFMASPSFRNSGLFAICIFGMCVRGNSVLVLLLLLLMFNRSLSFLSMISFTLYVVPGGTVDLVIIIILLFSSVRLFPISSATLYMYVRSGSFGLFFLEVYLL